MRRRLRDRLIVGAGTAATVVALSVGAASCGGSDGGSDAAPTTGPAIYAQYCATCHGANGQGFVGPRLAGVVTTKYPNVEDQIAVVTNGRGTMPAWGSRLSPAQIRAVVEYTRTKLGS